MKRSARRAAWSLAAALALAAAALTAALAGREPADWDPELAALVEGRPLTMAALNQVLERGLFNQLSLPGAEAKNDDVRRRVLDRLIDERLLLLEAAGRRLAVSEEEVDQAAARLDSAWFDRNPPADQLADLRSALSQRLMAHKITEKIMAEERRVSAEGWRDFWRDWPRERPARYNVRALFLPDLPDETEPPPRSRGELEQVAEKFRLEGFPVAVSEPLWLRGDRLTPDLAALLETSWARRRPSDPLKLEGSWVIYEVLTVERPGDAALEMRTARAAYELKAGEEAFRKWLEARRASADIRINPSLAAGAE